MKSQNFESELQRVSNLFERFWVNGMWEKYHRLSDIFWEYQLTKLIRLSKIKCNLDFTFWANWIISPNLLISLFGKVKPSVEPSESALLNMYTQCTYKCALSLLREYMLLSYHFYFFNLDNAFLKFWLTDLCMMDRKFIFLNCGNCSYWLLEVGNYFL